MAPEPSPGDCRRLAPAGRGRRGEAGDGGGTSRAYLRALAQQRLDESPTDALGPTGDQSHLPIDMHGGRAAAASPSPA